jgi:putative flippase GtrA
MAWQKMARFAVVGGGITAFNYVLYLAMIEAGFHYLVPTTIGWILGVVVSFFSNKYWTFERSGAPRIPEVGGFFVGYVLQLVLGSAGIFALIDVLGVDHRIAFPVNVVLTATFSYIFLNRVVFGVPRPASHPSH